MEGVETFASVDLGKPSCVSLSNIAPLGTGSSQKSCMVDCDGANIGWVNRLDGEAARRGGEESEVDVVVLGAQRRRAGIDDIDRELLRGR